MAGTKHGELFSRRRFIALGSTAALSAPPLATAALSAACGGLLAGSGALLTGCACGKTRYPSDHIEGTVLVGMDNLDGTVITFPANVTRVAAIFGPSYERIVAVGAEDRIVCCGDYHATGWPWSNVVYKRLNEVPGIPNAHSNLNVEDLMSLGVQVVFSFPNPLQTKAIANAGLYAVPSALTGKLRDIVESVRLYASVFGDKSVFAQAKAYEQYFDETLSLVKGRTADVSRRPRVYLAYTDLLHTYGEKSDMAELVDAAGGVLVSLEFYGSSNITVNAEQVLQWDPEFIFIDHAGSSGNASAESAIAQALSTGNFSNVTAVQRGQVHVTPTGVFFWDSGIQKILYLVYIAKTIHPDLFEDIDLKALLIDFYRKFYYYDLSTDQATRILRHENPA